MAVRFAGIFIEFAMPVQVVHLGNPSLDNSNPNDWRPRIIPDMLVNFKTHSDWLSAMRNTRRISSVLKPSACGRLTPGNTTTS